MSLLIKARELRNARRAEEAVPVYLEYARENPADAPRAITEAAECFLNINVLEQEVDLGPVRLIFQGDLTNAERLFRAALEIRPGHARALRGLVDVLKPEDPERRDLLERLLAVRPDFLAMVELGDFLRTQEKRYEEAYGWYKQAVLRRPNELTGYVKLQDICRKLGRAEEAEDWKRKWKQQTAPFRPTKSARDRAIEVPVSEDGWAVCPQCGFKFQPTNDNAYRDGRHRKCRQRLTFRDA